MDNVVIILLYGLSYGFLLFFSSVGLSMSLGMMGIVNVAHGVLFMLGGYIGITVILWTGNWVLGLMAAAIGAGLVGLIILLGFLQRLYKQQLQQVLLTFGFVYILANLSLWVWGPETRVVSVPAALSGDITLAGYQVFTYRLVLIGIGLVFFLAMWWLQVKTRFGAIIRAGMDDAEMVSGLGINLMPVLGGVFFVGIVIAGVAALIGSPILGGISPYIGTNVFFLALVVTIVGGVGYVQGALAGALIVGLLSVIMATYYPEMANVSVYLFMIVILLFRPQGLFGRKW